MAPLGSIKCWETIGFSVLPANGNSLPVLPTDANLQLHLISKPVFSFDSLV
jgi:hypothetical protein